MLFFGCFEAIRRGIAIAIPLSGLSRRRIEVVMDIVEHQARTVAVKACRSCGSGLLELHKFCRSCGAPQIDQGTQTQQTFTASEACRFTTSSLANAARGDVYRRVSGPLVSAVVTGALAAPPAEAVSPLARRAILALISIPIWLIIVLLSPLDAYAAVKVLARQA